MSETTAQAQMFAADPYPFYDAMRAMGPIVWMEQKPGRWVVTGHAAAWEILRDGRFSSDRRRWNEYTPVPGTDEMSGGMFVMDPPVHTRLRGLVQQAFTAKTVTSMRPRIEGLVADLVAGLKEQPEADLMSAFANPLPAVVLAELLGIPVEEQDLYRQWTLEFIEAVDPVSHSMDSEAGLAAKARIEEYLGDIIERRRADPRDDLISRMAQAEAEGERLSARELLEMSVLLTVAGLETTANLIGNGMNALLDFPAQADRLRADPSLIGSAVEELLRFDGPIQMSGRVATEEIEIGGVTLHEGQMVAVMGAAANRDPAVFTDPSKLDITRTPNQHLGFGRGIHFCLGAALARLEATVAILALVQTFPSMSRAGAPTRRVNLHVRGFETLPVTTF